MPQQNTHAPVKFYKYRSLAGEGANWVEQSVLKDEVYFAPALSFNDPFDLRPVFSLDATPARQREDFLRLSQKFEPQMSNEDREAWADRVMGSSLLPENVQATTDGIQALHNIHMSSAVGVYCVSETHDNILMWSHYADSHKGICLEFDGHAPFMAHAQQVKYSRERVPINMYEDDQMQGVEKALLTKSDKWAYEKEWRLIRYDQGPGVVKFRPSNLTGVIVGALAPREAVDVIRSWAKRRSAPLQLRRAVISREPVLNFVFEA